VDVVTSAVAVDFIAAVDSETGAPDDVIDDVTTTCDVTTVADVSETKQHVYQSLIELHLHNTLMLRR